MIFVCHSVPPEYWLPCQTAGRDLRILGHADVVAPALAGVHAGAGLEQLGFGLIEFAASPMDWWAAYDEGSRRRSRTSGSSRRGGCRCRPARSPPMKHVLAVLGDEEVLLQRRTATERDTGGVELGDPDAVASVAGRRTDRSRRRRAGCSARSHRSAGGRRPSSIVSGPVAGRAGSRNRSTGPERYREVQMTP